MAASSLEKGTLNMDGIREQLVKKEKSPSDGVKKIIIIVAAFMLAVVIVTIAGVFSHSWLILDIGIFLAIFIMWGGIFVAGNLNVEYEYSVVGSSLQIDKILNKRSRKTMCEINLRKAHAFCKGEHESDGTAIYACGDGDRYSIEYDDEKYGSTVLIFTPDDRTLEAIKPYLPRIS